MELFLFKKCTNADRGCLGIYLIQLNLTSISTWKQGAQKLNRSLSE